MNNNSSNKLHKSEQTRLRIMDAYLECMLDKYWENVSVKEICASANITRGTFYQYFNDIYDLLEQIEEPLLDALSNDYLKPCNLMDTSDSHRKENGEIDITPPKPILLWLEFCKDNKSRMKVLLSSNSDPYFITKLKKILSEQIAQMMDHDSMPDDELRMYFSKAFLELHFLTARAWLDSSEDDFLSTDEIINILNTMRIGANYLNRLNKK